MPTPLNPTVAAVTAALVARSRDTRAAYEAHMERARRERPHREDVSSGNFAHAFAPSSVDHKTSTKGATWRT